MPGGEVGSGGDIGEEGVDGILGVGEEGVDDILGVGKEGINDILGFGEEGVHGILDVGELDGHVFLKLGGLRAVFGVFGDVLDDRSGSVSVSVEPRSETERHRQRVAAFANSLGVKTHDARCEQKEEDGDLHVGGVVVLATLVVGRKLFRWLEGFLYLSLQLSFPSFFLIG